MRIMILNGANMNLLGVREPHIYGTTTLAAVEASCQEFAGVIGATVAFHQSNHEGDVVDWIHAARSKADAIVINPAGFSFHSIPVLDALKAFEGPVVELHISNIHARDELHRHSIISTVSKARHLRRRHLRLHPGHAGRRPHAGQAPRLAAHPDPRRPEVARTRHLYIHGLSVAAPDPGPESSKRLRRSDCHLILRARAPDAAGWGSVPG